MTCICGNALPTDRCCGAVIDGHRTAETAEHLMRSRYAAWALKRIDYLAATHDPETLASFDRKEASRWAEATLWRGLKIVEVEAGGPGDDRGIVEFVATYTTGGPVMELRERSRFRRHEGRWVYVDGVNKPRATGARVGRNEKCPCGSGKKHKRCCMR